MKKFKSTLLLTATFVLLSLSLTGCGGKDETTKDGSTNTEQGNNGTDNTGNGTEGDILNDMEQGAEGIVDDVTDGVDDIVDGNMDNTTEDRNNTENGTNTR